MRKFILFFILACLHVATRGQTIEGVDLSVLPKPTQAAKLQYWFDDNQASLSSQTQISGTYSIDVSSLLTGVHTIHYQIIDNKGMVGVPYSALFIKLAQFQLEASGLQYWFNDDDKSPKKTSLQNGISTIDVSGIGVGLHTLHYQILDSHNSPLYIASAMFMNMGENSGDGTLRAERLLYWYDDEEKLNNAEISSGIKTLDASHLPEGLHTLHYQVLCNNGSLTVASSAFFYRVNSDTSTAKAKQLRYWYDDQTSVLTASITSGTQMLDVSSLLAGIHVLHYQIVDDSGALGVPSSTMFMKMDAMEELAAAKSQRYWFDDDESNMRECAVANGVQELDVQNLEVGFHTLHYQLVDAAGNVTVPYSNVFMKTPEYALIDGKNAITRYQYWINDDATITSVDVAKPTSPYQLISLLPMPKAPIRSSSFHFEPKNGEPMIYAKNDVHFRFFDAAGYWGDEARSYIDYNVSQKVTGVSELVSTQTFERPEENGIKWFKFEAEEGDTIAFRCSQATSLQVFAPSGEEIYSAAGDKAVQYDGAHTWENGTYYVAIHDVTGSRTDVTLDYMHMDRYDVVDQDVKVVGNGGCSTITFQGNGFKDLYKVELYNAQGDTIRNAHIDYLSDASVAVRFNFTYAALGEYAAIFYFTEEEKKFNSCVVVEEAEDIMLSYDVIYASSFLRGTANTYTIKVKNSGNSTAYQVPLKIQLQANGGTNNITYIKLSDNLCFDDYAWLNDDSIPEKERLGLVELVHQKGNMLDFITINDIATQEEFMEGYFAINLPPCSTTTFTISVKSDSEVTVYTLLPDEWDYYAYTETALAKSNRRIRKASVKESMCCARTHVECAMNILASGLDYASLAGGSLAIASCIASVANTVIPFAYDMWCSETSNDKDEAMKSLYRNIISSIISCASKYDPYKIGWMIQHVNDVITTTMSCVSNPKQLPNCPPKPPKPHPSNPVNSLDPNDIYGYLSESGSKFVADSITALNYRIEFENDTTFATASAHTVIVKDTLDATKFDLSSYTPTSIKIGDKDVQLNGDKQFVTTIDMRPSIDAIAQVEGTYDEKKGIATWKFTSLDPMTMEETDDVMQGFLPINHDGNGIGEVAFSIDRLANLADGADINNKATIVFDSNDAIETPVWTNTIDAVAPTSKVTNVEMKEDSKFSIHFDGEDARSGIWKYDVYYRWTDDMDWIRIANGCDSTAFDKEAVAGYVYQFCVVATDMAGNVEPKSLTPEFVFSTGTVGDVNGDGKVTVSDAVKLIDHSNADSGKEVPLAVWDVNNDGNIDLQDAVEIIKIYLNNGKTQETKSRNDEDAYEQ